MPVRRAEDGWKKVRHVKSYVAGQVVGQFTCVMMMVAGESLCAPLGAETQSMTML